MDLEVLGGLVELAETQIGEADIVIRPVRAGRKLDGFEEILDARGGIAFVEQFRAFAEGFHGFAGESEVLDGDDGVAARRLRAGAGRKRQNNYGKEESGWFHEAPPGRRCFQCARGSAMRQDRRKAKCRCG